MRLDDSLFAGARAAPSWHPTVCMCTLGCTSLLNFPIFSRAPKSSRALKCASEFVIALS